MMKSKDLVSREEFEALKDIVMKSHKTSKSKKTIIKSKKKSENKE